MRFYHWRMMSIKTGSHWLSHSLFPFPIWIFAPKWVILQLKIQIVKFLKQLLLIFRHCVQNSILCFLTMYVIETWEKFFHIPKWIADHHFFSIQFFFVRTANIMRLKKGFFSNWYEHQSSAARRSEHVFNSWWPSRAMKSYTWTSRISAGNF